IHVCFFYFILFLFFFFSSRRRHTRCLSDWSSDVCSSDLMSNSPSLTVITPQTAAVMTVKEGEFDIFDPSHVAPLVAWLASDDARSEERRVGKECRSGW